MGEKREKTATRYPYSPIPSSPFFRRPQAFPLVPFTKLSIRYPHGKMGEIESIRPYPEIRVLRRRAVWTISDQGTAAHCEHRAVDKRSTSVPESVIV